MERVRYSQTNSSGLAFLCQRPQRRLLRPKAVSYSARRCASHSREGVPRRPASDAEPPIVGPNLSSTPTICLRPRRGHARRSAVQRYIVRSLGLKSRSRSDRGLAQQRPMKARRGTRQSVAIRPPGQESFRTARAAPIAKPDAFRTWRWNDR
jgi:hypothetical protein